MTDRIEHKPSNGEASIKEKSKMEPQKGKGNKGIYRQTFTRDEMLKIQRQWDDNDHKAMMEVDGYYPEEEVTDDTGIIALVGRWWSKQRQQVQQDHLRKRVEEQKIVLEQEALRLRNEEYITKLFNSSAGSVGADGAETESAPQHYRQALDQTTTSSQPVLAPPKVTGNLDISDPIPTKSGIGMQVQFNIPNTSEDNPQTEGLEEMLTTVTIEEEPPSEYPFCAHILSPETMKTLACQALPASLLFNRWNRLYSLARDGDSFDTMLRLVKGSEKTLLVIRTTTGEVFGSFADSEWRAQHSAHQARSFYGGGQSRLFKILKTNNDVKIYKWTGANRFFQICDYEKKMLAMGGGGTDGAFGLCVQDDFKRGSTGRCETYGNDPLSDENRGSFDILDLEVWGFISGFF